MYHRFDMALQSALESESSLFGVSERSIAVATARRAASENRVKAMNEATLGKVAFAAIHDTASTRFHEDAERMSHGLSPVHHAISFYLSTAKAYRKADAKNAAEVVPHPAPGLARAA